MENTAQLNLENAIETYREAIEGKSPRFLIIASFLQYISCIEF